MKCFLQKTILVCFSRKLPPVSYPEDAFHLMYYVYRRLGGESKPGNLNGSCERDAEAGVLQFD